jgi:hypothetical protein
MYTLLPTLPLSNPYPVPGLLVKKRGKKIPSKFHLLFNKSGHLLPPFLSNESGTGIPWRHWDKPVKGLTL